MRVFDYLKMEVKSATHVSESGTQFLDELIEKWTPESKSRPWMRLNCAAEFFQFLMGLAAFGHDKAKDAYEACIRWCRLTLEISDNPNEVYSRFKSYYYLSNAHWLWAGTSPPELVPPMVEAARIYEAIPERHDASTYVELSFAHAQAGDWDQALHTLNKARGSRPIVLNTRGAMSPIQALAWAYAQLKSGDPPPVDMKRRYVAAMRKYLSSEDGLLAEIPIWLRPYQLLFEPQSQPADLLQLLRPLDRSTE